MYRPSPYVPIPQFVDHPWYWPQVSSPAIIYQYRQLPVMIRSDHVWSSFTTISHRHITPQHHSSQLPTMNDHLWISLTIIIDSSPSSSLTSPQVSTINQHEPPWSSTNHHSPLPWSVTKSSRMAPPSYAWRIVFVCQGCFSLTCDVGIAHRLDFVDAVPQDAASSASEW